MAALAAVQAQLAALGVAAAVPSASRHLCHNSWRWISYVIPWLTEPPVDNPNQLHHPTTLVLRTAD